MTQEIEQHNTNCISSHPTLVNVWIDCNDDEIFANNRTSALRIHLSRVHESILTSHDAEFGHPDSLKYSDLTEPQDEPIYGNDGDIIGRGSYIIGPDGVLFRFTSLTPYGAKQLNIPRIDIKE